LSASNTGFSGACLPVQTTLRVLVADDEPLARQRLCRLLGEHGDVEVLAQCCDGAEVLATLKADSTLLNALDVLFLDIQMPGLDGLALAALLGDSTHFSAKIVFVTAFSEFAAHAFDLDVLDYLLKPISGERLAQALGKARRGQVPAVIHGQGASNQVAQTAIQTYADRIALPIGQRMQLVETDTIDVVLAQANYVEIRANQRSFLVRRSLDSVIATLDPQKFIRVHRSCAVRILAIAEAQSLPSGRFMLRLKDGSKLHAARSYRAAVGAALGL
jgi:two-component system, LytTR family, response regulator